MGLLLSRALSLCAGTLGCRDLQDFDQSERPLRGSWPGLVAADRCVSNCKHTRMGDSLRRCVRGDFEEVCHFFLQQGFRDEGLSATRTEEEQNRTRPHCLAHWDDRCQWKRHRLGEGWWLRFFFESGGVPFRSVGLVLCDVSSFADRGS